MFLAVDRGNDEGYPSRVDNIRVHPVKSLNVVDVHDD